MRRDQIRNVDVIADAGAIRCGIVGAVDLRGLTLTQRNTQDKRNEMGFGLVRFAALGQRATGIEITQGGKMQSMDLSIPIQSLLDHQLGMPVYIGGSERRLLCEWFLTGLIHSRGG